METNFENLNLVQCLAKIEHSRDRIAHALKDFKNQSCSYKVLAEFGEMERTPNGYKSIDPEAFVLRCKRLDQKLAELQIKLKNLRLQIKDMEGNELFEGTHEFSPYTVGYNLAFKGRVYRIVNVTINDSHQVVVVSENL